MKKLSKKTLLPVAMMGGMCAGMVAAPAASALTVGPGNSTMTIDHTVEGTSSLKGGCAVNSTGTDQNGNKLLITAGHCTEKIGDEVFLVTDKENIAIGKTIHTTQTPRHEDGTIDWEGDDFAVVQLYDTASNGEKIEVSSDSDTTTLLSLALPMNNVSGEAVKPHNEDADYVGRLVWKDGTSTGHIPGIVVADHGHYVDVLTLAVPGDSGGAVYDMQTNEMIGINSRDESIGEEGGGQQFAWQMSAHTNRDAVGQWEEETGNEFTYAEDATPQAETMKQPLVGAVREAIPMVMDDLRQTWDEAWNGAMEGTQE